MKRILRGAAAWLLLAALSVGAVAQPSGGAYGPQPAPGVAVTSIIQRPGLRVQAFGDSEDNFNTVNTLANSGLSGQFIAYQSTGVLATANKFLGGQLNFDLSVGWPQSLYLGGLSKIFVVSGGSYSVAPTGATVTGCGTTTLGTPVSALVNGSYQVTSVPITAETGTCPTGSAVVFSGGTGTAAVAYGIQNQGGSFGASGATTSQMVQFMRDACAAPVDVLVMHGGTNDNGAGISVAQTEANLVQIWTTLMGPACGGKTVVYFSLLPRNYAQGAAAYFQLAALTRWARQWIAGEQALRPSGYGNIIFIDREPECTDQTSAAGNFTSDCSADGLHEGVWGPWKLSWKLAQALKPMLGNFGAYISTSQNDTYDATNNPTGALAMSPFYTMTGGTVNSPCTGSVPSGWQIARYAGSATGTICAGSTESTRSDLISGSRYQITQSLGSGTSSEYFELQPNNNFTPATLGVTLGTDAVFSQVWVEISNVANVTSITLNTTCENGGGATVQESQDAIWPANSGTLYGPSTSLQFPLITPPIVCPVGTSYIGENLAWTFNASGGAASATMTMKLANFTTRKYF